jgi:hypothetical protein
LLFQVRARLPLAYKEQSGVGEVQSLCIPLLMHVNNVDAVQ